jgi:hypothetical protein
MTNEVEFKLVEGMRIEHEGRFGDFCGSYFLINLSFDMGSIK